MLRKAILAAAESPRLQRFVRQHGMRLGAARFVAGRRSTTPSSSCAGSTTRGLQGEHDAARRGRRERGRDARRRRRLRGDPRPHRRRTPAGQRRAQADPPRPRLRRGARAREHRRARRARCRARQLRPARHGGVGLRRPDAAGLSVVCARTATRTSAPCSSPTSTARPADLEGLLDLDAEPPLRQGRLPRAAGGRLPGEEATSTRPTSG